MSMQDWPAVIIAAILFALVVPSLVVMANDKNSGVAGMWLILGPLALIPYAIILLFRLLFGRPVRGG